MHPLHSSSRNLSQLPGDLCITCPGPPSSGPGHTWNQELQKRFRSDPKRYSSWAEGQRLRRGWGEAGCQVQLGDPKILIAPSQPAHSLASCPPPLALGRSMLPLLTAENRARLPAPSYAPPARQCPPRSSQRIWGEFTAEALHPGAGPAEGAAGAATALGRRRGKIRTP